MSVVVIPSRLGTRDKGMWLLGGRPLVHWVLDATRAWPQIVTTDSPRVENLAHECHARCRQRPPHLATGESGMLEKAVLDALDAYDVSDDTLVHLCQPTSPFLQPDTLRTIEREMRLNPRAASAQSVTCAPHNYHQWNARRRRGAYVYFDHPKKRFKHRTKESKPEQWAFGNAVSIYAGKLRQTQWLFEEPCIAVEVPRFAAWDVDNEEDLIIAEALIGRLV